LRSTRVVLPDGIAAATVLLDGGRIEAVVRGPGAGPARSEIVDVGDLVVSPGLVDGHVHINEPGRTDWEGFETATRAAVAGGVTTAIDMPLNCLPVTTRAAALEAKLHACAGKLRCDVGFWGGVIPDNVGELGGLAEAGVLGCKAFLVHSGIDEFPNVTERDLRRAMPVLRALGLPLLAHAELDLGLELGGAPAPPPDGGDPRAYRGYLASRPRAWEDQAIQLLVRLSRETGCAVHVVHLSSASSIDTLRAAKAEGLPVSVETCPHYLCLEAEAIPDGATHFKCAPPIREHENREALWRALFEGVIDFVVTDHSPCAPELKQRERGDFQRAWGGISSLQLGLPAVWTEARRRGGTPAQIAAWMSAGPARLAGLSARKGSIAAGRDADLVVWDPEASFVVDPERLLVRHKLSPYAGQRLHGRVEQTFLRGQRVYDRLGDSDGADPAPTGAPILNPHRPEEPRG
jgi:allantoinase